MFNLRRPERYTVALFKYLTVYQQKNISLLFYSAEPGLISFLQESRLQSPLWQDAR